MLTIYRRLRITVMTAKARTIIDLLMVHLTQQGLVWSRVPRCVVMAAR
jgi:hypothetical protein